MKKKGNITFNIGSLTFLISNRSERKGTSRFSITVFKEKEKLGNSNPNTIEQVITKIRSYLNSLQVA